MLSFAYGGSAPLVSQAEMPAVPEQENFFSMSRIPSLVRSFSRSFASPMALALSLVAGSTVVTAAISTPAMAQRQAKPNNSKAFAAVYQPVADVVNAGTDLSGVKAQLPAIVSAIETPDDRNSAGNLILLAGNKLNDKSLQRQGLELMVQSGKVDPAQLGQIQYFIGSLAYEAQDWAAARTALQAAQAAGYTEDGPEGLIAESYFKEGQNQQGLTYLKGLIEQRKSAGQQVPEGWALRGLQVAYQANLSDAAIDWSTLLVAQNPSAENWIKALQVVNSTSAADDPQVRLDLLRLMALTDALSDRREFISYIETADPRIMANEVATVLDAGIRAGVFSNGDEYYAEVKRVVDLRASADKEEAPKLASEARSAANGRPAQNAGDVYLSLGSFAEAEEMYALAIEKGGVDRDQMLTRQGIAQVRQGKFAEARATFGQVSGTRAAVARMWSAYADSRV